MNNKIIPFEEFEKAIMQKMLEEKNVENEILLEQYRRSQVIKRDFTGAGFFTNFEVPANTPHVEKLTSCSFGDVIASINGSTFDFGFVLFLKDGMLSCLEGYTWADAWPETIESYELKHSDNNPL